MPQSFDVQAEHVRQNVDIVTLIGNSIKLERRGSDYVGRCPFHNDKDPSLTVDPRKGLWHCFGCKAGGDAIEFVKMINNVEFGEALKILSDQYGHGAPAAPLPHQQESAPVILQKSVPKNSPPPPSKHYKLGEPVHRWTYHNADGSIAFHVDRYDTEDGKEMRPLSWGGKADDAPSWQWKHMPKDRPLYNLPRIIAEPDAPIMVVEGEKAADAAQKLTPAIIVTTWAGGGSAIQKTDWKPLEGRNVLLWPDADQPGIDTMTGYTRRGKIHDGVAQILEPVASRILTVTPPEDVAEGWDLADAAAEGWTKEQVYNHIKETKQPWPPPVPSTPAPAQVAPPKPVAKRTPIQTPPVPTTPQKPFKPLGYDHDKYYFLPSNTQQIAELTPASLTRPNMLRLADLDYWESNYPSKQGVLWSDAAADLMEACHAVGPYYPGRIRGRGAWVDGGDLVLHLGNQLLVNGAIRDFHAHKGLFIYERGAPLETKMVAKPATSKESNEFGRLFDRLHWSDRSSAFLAAGFAFLAPICGALRWRPHVFITGPRGCGKTWILQNMVAPLMGAGALLVEGSTTEAGIRQAMKADALPIVFDELDQLEGRRNDAGRIQGIFELARLASSENTMQLVKGSGTGEAIGFRCRSMFLFGAISSDIKRAADSSRISVLELKSPPNDGTANAMFRQLENDVAALMTEQYLASLRARAYHMIPVIRKSAEILADVISQYLGEQRLGDQLGSLLAGAHCLMSDDVITDSQAQKMLDVIKHSKAADYHMDSGTDEEKCLNAILQYQIRVETDNGPATRSVAELILVAAKRTTDDDFGYMTAENTLRRHGIKAQNNPATPDHFSVSNTHNAIAKILRDTVYGYSWPNYLVRLPFAERQNTTAFGGSKTRAVLVPINLIDIDD